MLRFNLSLAALLLLIACGTPESAPVPLADPRRGELLYDTACLQCHTTQPHWRDKSVVGSWESLLAEVDRWQKASGQRWSEAEIRDVADFLNRRFYKLPAPGVRS